MQHQSHSQDMMPTILCRRMAVWLFPFQLRSIFLVVPTFLTGQWGTSYYYYLNPHNSFCLLISIQMLLYQQ